MVTRRNGSTEKLVKESEALRQQLLKMAARLEVFTNELLGEAQFLSRTASHSEVTHERDDTAGPAGAGPGAAADRDGPGDQL